MPEDDVDGRFFAKRFESDRLETEADVLACSLYVDLNWIHAGMADTPEQSHYTSAADRIRARWRAMAIEFGGESGKKMSEFPPDDDWLAPIFLDERAEAQRQELGDTVHGRPSLGTQSTRASLGTQSTRASLGTQSKFSVQVLAD